MLDILTFGGNDVKMFIKVQKALNDNEAVRNFAGMYFSDLVKLENNAVIKKFLEATVRVEASDSEEAQALMRNKYALVNKTCDTFFSKNENIAFIGVSLLQTARKEKNLQRKEAMLKQAIE